MLKLVSFVGPMFRLFGSGMGMLKDGADNVAKMADRNPKTSSGVVGLGAVMAMAPEWLKPIVEMLNWLSSTLAGL